MHIGYIITFIIIGLVIIYFKEVAIFATVVIVITVLYYIIKKIKIKSIKSKKRQLEAEQEKIEANIQKSFQLNLVDLEIAYPLNPNVGQFLPDIDYIQSHIKINKIRNQTPNVDVCKLVLYAAECDVSAHGIEWEGSIGTLDKAAYAIAAQNYDHALNSYKNDKNNFAEKEEQRKKRSKNYSRIYWQGTPPSRADIENFTTYKSQSGLLTGQIELDWVVIGSPQVKNKTESGLVSPQTGEKIEIDRVIFMNRVLNFYRSIISNKSIKSFLEKNEINPNQEFIKNKNSDEILHRFKNIIDINLVRFNIANKEMLDISVRNRRVLCLPFVVTVSIIDGEVVTNYHDHLYPDVEIKANLY